MKKRYIKVFTSALTVITLACSNVLVTKASFESDTVVTRGSKTDITHVDDETITTTTTDKCNLETGSDIVIVEEKRVNDITNRTTETTTTTADDPSVHIVRTNIVKKDGNGKSEETIKKLSYSNKVTHTIMNGVIEQGLNQKANLEVETGISTFNYISGQAKAEILLPYEMIEDFATGTTKENPLDITINVPDKEVLKLIKNDKIQYVSIVIQAPSRIFINQSIKLKNVLLKDSIIKTGSVYKTAVSVDLVKIDVSGTAKNNTMCSWYFNSNGVIDVNNTNDKNINLTINNEEVQKETIVSKILNTIKQEKLVEEYKKNSSVYSINYDGKLRCNQIKLYVGDKLKAGDAVYQYYVNQGKSNFEQVPNNKLIVDKEGYVEAKYQLVGQYLFTKKELPKELYVSLFQQVKNIPQEKTIEKDKSFTIKPQLPILVRKVSKFNKTNDGSIIDAMITYTSSNISVATVDKISGKVTAKTKGNVVITTIIKLGDGSSEKIKTNLTVE